jgi:hypothetical protein
MRGRLGFVGSWANRPDLLSGGRVAPTIERTTVAILVLRESVHLKATKKGLRTNPALNLPER